MTRGIAWVGMALLVTAVACSGKKRPFADGIVGGPGEVESLTPGPMGPADQNGMTADDEATPLDPALVASEPSNEIPAGSAGAPCVTGADCDAPGQCVDGVCCSSACGDLCAACNVPGSLGTCSAAPIEAACGTLQCAGVDTECRKLDTSQLTLNCEAFGACKTRADCAVLSEPSGTPCENGAGACDGAGACIVAGKASLGQTCGADADCAEGHCVAAGESGALICCDAACDSPCQACSAAGHCEVTPTTDTRCEAVACPVDDVCRDYTADVTANQCRGFGQCQTGLDCERVALRPEAECECDATTGACGLRAGATCADAAECTSGVCTANGQGVSVCCADACAAGLFCSNDGAACVACEGAAIECEGNSQRTCNAGTIATTPCPNGCTPGIGCNALPPLGFRCDAGQCAAPNVCQVDTTGAARCCSRDCAAENKICAENGSCVCRPGEVAAGNSCLLQDGDPCQTTQQCQAGSTCTDGVCCQEACNGSCERCEPNTGLCVAIGQGQQDNQCTNGRQCTGARGDCRLTVRQPCSGNGAECTTNACEPTVGDATQICCSQACSGNRPFCRSTGQGCVQCETNSDCGNGCNTQTGLCNELLPIGTPCGASAQCASGAQCLLDQSSQTRCCERNCGAEGLLCNGAGRCVAPAPATLATAVGGTPTAFPRTLVDSTSTTTRLWTVQNVGGSPTPPLSLQGSVEFPASGNCLNSVLQPGASCSLTISFAPRSAGTRAATLTLRGGQGVAVSVGIQGQARLRDGSTCSPNDFALCDSNRCTEWLPDLDGDGFGSTVTVGGQPSVFICGDGSPENRPPPLQLFEGNLPCFGGAGEWQYAPSRGINDCCDHPCPGVALDTVSSALAFPGATVGGTRGANCAPGVFTSDFNCNGRIEVVQPEPRSILACTGAPQAVSAAICAARSGFFGELACGQTTNGSRCGLVDGLCTSVGPFVSQFVQPVCL